MPAALVWLVNITAGSDVNDENIDAQPNSKN